MGDEQEVEIKLVLERVSLHRHSGNPVAQEVQGGLGPRFKNKLRHNHFQIVALDAAMIIRVSARLASDNKRISSLQKENRVLGKGTKGGRSEAS